MLINQHISLIKVYLGSTQRECKSNKDVVDKYKNMFESLISEAATEKLPANVNANVIARWACETVRRTVLRIGKRGATAQGRHAAHRRPSAENGRDDNGRRIAESLLPNRSEMPLQGAHRQTGHPVVFEPTCQSSQEMHKLVTSAWQGSSRTFITRAILDIVTWETALRKSRLGLFQDSHFAGDFEDYKSTSGGILCVFGSHKFVPISQMCKKQMSVSHSTPDDEVKSLDAGLRMDGFFALDLWDLVIEVLQCSTSCCIDTSFFIDRTAKRDE